MDTAALAQSLHAWMPELILSVGAMAVLLLGVFARRPAPALAMTWAALAGSAAALAVVQHVPAGPWFFGAIVLDAWSHVFRWIALGTVALVVLMAPHSSDVEPSWRSEYLGLLLFAGVGLMLMAQAQHLLMAYLAIEMVSMSSYVLVALARDARGSEAALKYLLFGALCSGIMLFGMSLLFGLTGQMSFPGLREAAGALAPSAGGAAAVSVALVLVGLAFKISMVPFHMWTPDVYEGAPLPVTALLSVGPKAAGLALLWRFVQALAPVWGALAETLVWLTIVTMTLGNVVAVVQSNVKRLLAYSTIGQVGYLLIGFVVQTELGRQALLVYLVAYLFMNLGAFACVTAVCHDAGSPARPGDIGAGGESLEAFRGLAHRAPGLALALAVFLLSLAGIPPLLGFLGKFLLFGSAIASRWTILAVVGVINSAIALYYYVN
ncbi:MAG: NADH-quinone oxidoreductase subunit N, partial [Candidatus Omnitrophica bacterium]|nr:NADH-quinone oxidoreductase subunit N [Candidatus Omnitrophota bacterium]